MRLVNIILILAVMLVADGGSHGYISRAATSARAPISVFEDSFETETNWQMSEEIVDKSPCYDSGIGRVIRSTDVSYDGLNSLLVWANQQVSPVGVY